MNVCLNCVYPNSYVRKTFLHLYRVEQNIKVIR